MGAYSTVSGKSSIEAKTLKSETHDIEMHATWSCGECRVFSKVELVPSKNVAQSIWVRVAISRPPRPSKGGLVAVGVMDIIHSARIIQMVQIMLASI